MLGAGREPRSGLSRRMRAVMMALVCTTSSRPMLGQLRQISLNEGWRFRAVASAEHPEAGKWRAATVPGVVQADLQAAGVIPDPFWGDNEKQLQGTGVTGWEDTKDVNGTQRVVWATTNALVVVR